VVVIFPPAKAVAYKQNKINTRSNGECLCYLARQRPPSVVLILCKWLRWSRRLRWQDDGYGPVPQHMQTKCFMIISLYVFYKNCNTPGQHVKGQAEQSGLGRTVQF
jgi:hypothetical protein